MNVIQQNSNSSVVKCVWPATRQTQVPTPTSALLHFLLWLCYHTTNKTFEWLTSLPICYLIHSGGGGVKYRSPPHPSHPWPRNLVPPCQSLQRQLRAKHIQAPGINRQPKAHPADVMPVTGVPAHHLHEGLAEGGDGGEVLPVQLLILCVPAGEYAPHALHIWVTAARNQVQGPAHRLDIHLLSWEWPGNGHIPWHAGSDIHCPESGTGHST